MNDQVILTFDYGTQWIGVAVGQKLTGTASLLPPIKARDGIPNWDDIKKLLEDWKPDAVLVGIPTNMDGSMSDMGLRANKFKNRIHGRFGISTLDWDERLTSFEAKGILLAQDRRKRDFKNRDLDSLAAQLIFESWFENNH